MIIKYARISETAKTPTRSNPSDAGLDVYSDTESFLLDPGDSAIISTGLKFEVPHGYMLQVMNRSSVASKKHLLVGAHVIDPNYNGEVFVNLINVGAYSREIKHGAKIAQIVMVPVVHARIEEMEEAELYKEQVAISSRGEGGFGSTGE